MFVGVFSDESKKVTFYTVYKEEDCISETEDFFRRMYQSEYTEHTKRLARLISESIGNKYGAHEKYFSRHERLASALPPKPHDSFWTEEIISLKNSPLRLYALRISYSVVVLFNGGLKMTNGSAQDDPNVSIYFLEAQRFAKKIIDAINEEMICVSHKSLVDFQGNKNFFI